MAFTAAKPVPCIKCHATINKGEPISWTRGKGAQPGVYHFVCPQDAPAAVTFASPETVQEPIQEPAESDLGGFYAQDLPDIEPEPLPGTRRWFRTASMQDIEEQLRLACVESVTRRDFVKVVTRYSVRLGDRDASRIKRYARGLWDGRVARLPIWGGGGSQMALFPEESTVTQDSENTQAWRSLIADWQRVGA